MQVGTRRTVAPAIFRGALHHEETFLLVTVDVFSERVAGLNTRFDVGSMQGTQIACGGDFERAVAAPEFVPASIAGLHAFEVGEAVRESPAGELVRGPAIVVERVSAEVHQAVDGGRAPHHFPARTGEGLAVQVWLRLTAVRPVVSVVSEGNRVRRRHSKGVEAAIHRPRLEHAYRGVGVLRQTVGEHAAGRTGPDNDVVDAVDNAWVCHQFFSEFPQSEVS